MGGLRRFFHKRSNKIKIITKKKVKEDSDDDGDDI